MRSITLSPMERDTARMLEMTDIEYAGAKMVTGQTSAVRDALLDIIRPGWLRPSGKDFLITARIVSAFLAAGWSPPE